MTAITLHSVTLGVFVLISFMVFVLGCHYECQKMPKYSRNVDLISLILRLNRIQTLKNQQEAEKRVEFGIFLAEYLHIKVQNFLFWFF